MSTREIQFRGISHCDGKTWLYGLPMIDNHKDCAKDHAWHLVDDFENSVHGVTESIGMPASMTLKTRVIRETIGQYTGLKDKKGEKIFEGDVLANYTDQGPLYGVVVFDKTHAGFGVSHDGETPIEYETSFFGFDPCGCMEVIGNIHDGLLPDDIKKQIGI